MARPIARHPRQGPLPALDQEGLLILSRVISDAGREVAGAPTGRMTGHASPSKGDFRRSEGVLTRSEGLLSPPSDIESLGKGPFCPSDHLKGRSPILSKYLRGGKRSVRETFFCLEGTFFSLRPSKK